MYLLKIICTWETFSNLTWFSLWTAYMNWSLEIQDSSFRTNTNLSNSCQFQNSLSIHRLRKPGSLLQKLAQKIRNGEITHQFLVTLVTKVYALNPSRHTNTWFNTIQKATQHHPQSVIACRVCNWDRPSDHQLTSHFLIKIKLQWVPQLRI